MFLCSKDNKCFVITNYFFTYNLIFFRSKSYVFDFQMFKKQINT